MKGTWIILNLAFALVLLLSAVVPAAGKGETSGYQTGFTLWRGDDFSGWNFSGTTVSDGALVLDQTTAKEGTDLYAPGTYNGGNYYNGGSYNMGEAVSPIVGPEFSVKEAIASWNALTPPGTWVEVLIRAEIAGSRFTKWYSLGIWASDLGTVQRHSVNLQGDTDGYVAVDTWVRTKAKEPVTGLQVAVRLFSASGVEASPTLKSLGLTYSTEAPKKITPSTGSPVNWNKLLLVPECSQMVYPGGGEVWCSPTSTSMVLGYYGVNAGPCEPRVRDAVDGVYDWVYDGHGNWPFNTAYAAAESNLALEGFVRRYTSLADLEPWVEAGVPVIFSFAWGKGDLDGAAIDSSNGHLAVLVGFDPAGNPIVNDPAAAADADVQRTYNRAQLETQWLTSSGGTVYLIAEAGTVTVP